MDGKGLNGGYSNDLVLSLSRSELIASESVIGKLLEWWAEADNGAFYASATGDDAVLWLEMDSGKRLGRCAHEARRTNKDLAELLG